MKKRLTSIILLLCIVVSLLTACDSGSDILSAEDAQKIVMEDLGASAGELEMHTHVGTHEDVACYSIYVTVDGQSLEYMIDAATGEILAINESSHSH